MTTTLSKNSQNQLTLLQQYSKTLQDQNQALLNQIRTMRSQLDKQSTQTKIISSSTSVNTVTSCSNCKNKQLQITNLNKSIKQLRDTYQTDIKKLKSIPATVQTVQKVVYKQIQKQNKTQTAQLQRLKRSYDQLRLKYQQSQKIQWSSIKVDSSNINISEQSKQQILTLRNQNTSLISKIEFLQKRLQSIQDSNQLLQEQLTNYKNKFNAVNINTSIPTQQSQTAQYIRPSIISQTGPQLPTFRYISPSSPPKTTSIETPTLAYPPVQVQGCGCSYLSPLSIFEHRHHSHPHNHNHTHHNYGTGYKYYQSTSNLNNSYQSDYYKDIVQERWRSLQHKIKILEEQNGKLRSQFRY